ncbi:chromosomal replication initiator protein DnaA [Persicimonas caeni]|uniref:Chromosomal replication initiator protein DnaA n=1 Tax=Persicimonas caeni TaxID=2292766 RepID=A0A4Y6PTY9_PERCE|nr:chromosomal replication initiator protein DnaA [Persicimonas caeni]QDG51487.1 chromosomal replication initiator protein DnaA [Persicimonas caeni]QED32708.1 chromosomal replication initiator protein DnaA [Persicimonas caeni]
MTDIWQAALRDLQEKVSSHNFQSWFKNIKYHHCDGQTYFLEVGDEFLKAWIEDNYLDLIEDSLEVASGEPVEVKLDVASAYERQKAGGGEQVVQSIDAPEEAMAARMGRLQAEGQAVVDAAVVAEPSGAGQTSAGQSQMKLDRASDAAVRPSEPNPSPQELAETMMAAGINPRHDFDEFVVGPSNQFVHAACSAVADNPGGSYNPLFIFGGVGLGKTHLLHAVGIEAIKRNPQARVVNLSSEDFMNQLITSLRQKDMNSFRTQFRNNCDVLLIDDIQFIAGKDSTQEEFFHTFNALYHSGKQIVITSDVMPKDLPGIEERLRSRFSWGLCADIQPPEMETRIAILEKKAEADGIEMDKDVAILLASSIRSNVRELEGTLIRLGAQASLMNQPITLDLAREMLDRMNIEQGRELSTEYIIEVVASDFGITPRDIKGSRRTRAISKPRQYAMYLARKHTDHSYPQLGEQFGGKDHTTVLAACKKIGGLIEDGDEEMTSLIDGLEAKLLR